MPPTVHEYIFGGAAPALIDVYAPARLRSPGLFVLLVCAGAAMLWWRACRASSRGRQPWALRLLPYAAVTTAYLLRWNHIDEVAINLEHAFNLHHFGRFSFTPTGMVDGTVEYAYYLLLTPFAWSAASVVAANFVLGWLITLAHVAIVSRLFVGAPGLARFAVLMMFSVYYPLVAQLANGFGNSLVSLATLLAVQAWLSNRVATASALACALPLLRPDAVLYSYALLLAFWLHGRRAIDRTAVIIALAPAMALLIYLGVHRAAYHHWIPTPLLFKSVHPSLVTWSSIKIMLGVVADAVRQPPQVAALLAVSALPWITPDRTTVLLRRLLWPFTLVFLFYAFSKSAGNDFSGTAYARYWIGFELVLFLSLAQVLVRLAALTHDSAATVPALRSMAPAALVAFMVAAITWDRATTLPNRRDMGYAAQIVDAVVPRAMSLSTTELNTFGLMIADREVIDLWGYTRPEIARSRILNQVTVRTDPALFLSLKPDVYFDYGLGDASDVEISLASSGGVTGKAHHRLGDLYDVLSRYDVVLLRHPSRTVGLLVRRDRMPELQQSLARHAYAAQLSRPFDLAQFRARYDRTPLELRRF